MNAPYKIMKNTLLKLTTNNQYIKTNCSHCSSSLTPILPRVCMQHHPLNDALDGSPLTISVHRYVFLLVCSKLEVPLSNYRSMLSVPQKKSRKKIYRVDQIIQQTLMITGGAIVVNCTCFLTFRFGG